MSAGSGSPDPVHVAMALAYERSLATVGAALAARRVAPVLVKGQALVDLCFGPDEPRLASDIDLLVGEDEPAVAVTLEALGYREERKARRRFSQPYLGERVFVHPELVPVELQTRLDKQVRRPIDYAGVRARARPSGRPGLRYPMADDLLLLVVLHASVADSLDIERAAADLDHLVRRAPLDWKVIAARAKTWRLERALQRWLGLAAERCGTQTPLTPAPPAPTVLAPQSRRLPGGVRHFVTQLGWHDSPWPVVTSAARYSALRLIDSLLP